jgi:hypothetical protein
VTPATAMMGAMKRYLAAGVVAAILTYYGRSVLRALGYPEQAQ